MNNNTTFNSFLKSLGRKSIGTIQEAPKDILERLASIEEKLGIEVKNEEEENAI